MPDQTIQTILEKIAIMLSISASSVGKVRFLEAVRLASCFPVTPLAAASITAAGLAISDLVGELGSAPSVCVDHPLASLWFGFSIHPQGLEIAASWGDLADDYLTSGCWIKLHTNAAHHKAVALNVLGCAANKAALVVAVQYRNGTELEEAIAAAGSAFAPRYCYPDRRLNLPPASPRRPSARACPLHRKPRPASARRSETPWTANQKWRRHESHNLKTRYRKSGEFYFAKSGDFYCVIDTVML